MTSSGRPAGPGSADGNDDVGDSVPSWDDGASMTDNDSPSHQTTTWDSYRKAIVEVSLEQGSFVVGPRSVLATQEVPFPADASEAIHVITTENPGGTTGNPESNAAATTSLLADLRHLGVRTVAARGGNLEWTHTEASVAAVGLTDGQAIELGRKYGQDAIFRWSVEAWSVVDCADGTTFNYAWGCVNGTAELLRRRDDFAELTRWADSTQMPLVTWDEVREHLKRRLMMDEQWILEGDREFVWWPTPLPLKVSVVHEDEFPNGDNLLRVNAETDIAYTDDEALGVEVVSKFRHRYPTGTLIYENGVVRTCTAIALNPLSRSVLTAFHESILIQAAVALELADEWAGIEGLLWPDDATRAHPITGARKDSDELVSIYGSTLNTSNNSRQADETRDLWDVARHLMRERLTGEGWLEGFTNEEVDFYFAPDDELVELAVGVNPDDWRVNKYGLGLTVWARLLPSGEAFDNHGTNLMNIALMHNFVVSAHGHITGGPDEENRGSILSAYLPLNVWSEYAAHGAQSLAVTVGNYARQCGYVSRAFRNWSQEIEQQSTVDE